MWTATSHIVAAVVGSGVLALAWTVAQLGWVVGPLVLVGFSCVTYYTSTLLANCYRYPDPVTGTANREYIDAVRCYLGIIYISHYNNMIVFLRSIRRYHELKSVLTVIYTSIFSCVLGPKNVMLCGCAQYVNLWGTLVGYTITASASMM